MFGRLFYEDCYEGCIRSARRGLICRTAYAAGNDNKGNIAYVICLYSNLLFCVNLYI